MLYPLSINIMFTIFISFLFTLLLFRLLFVGIFISFYFIAIYVLYLYTDKGQKCVYMKTCYEHNVFFIFTSRDATSKCTVIPGNIVLYVCKVCELKQHFAIFTTGIGV